MYPVEDLEGGGTGSLAWGGDGGVDVFVEGVVAGGAEREGFEGNFAAVEFEGVL